MNEAPLYIVAFDLTVRVEALAAPLSEALARARAAAHDLLEATALALTFPAIRYRQLARADAAVVRVRMALRVLAALGTLTAGAGLSLHESLGEAGRMIGGWRRSVRHGRRAASAPRAATGACAAAPSTTTPTGAAPPTATGTGLRGPMTTSGSASCSPPPPAAPP